MNFHTECWFLTLEAHHLSVVPCIRRYQRRLRVLKDLQRAVEELEKTQAAWSSNPAISFRNKELLKKYKAQIKVPPIYNELAYLRQEASYDFSFPHPTSSLPKRVSKSKMCADGGLLDRNLFQRCVTFYSSVSEFLLQAMTMKSDSISPKISISPLDKSVSVVRPAHSR